MKESTPVIALLSLVWRECRHNRSQSWGLLNGSMAKALNLAITSGFQFALEDVAEVSAKFRGSKWLDKEHCYGTAIESGNVSAAQSFEKAMGRPPFIADATSHSKRGRLAVGVSFPWRGDRLTVTSFGRDGEVWYLTACSYKDTAKRKVARCHRITVADIQSDRAERKERVGLEKRCAGSPRSGEAFRRASGIRTRKKWDATPVDRIREIVEQVEAEEAKS